LEDEDIFSYFEKPRDPIRFNAIKMSIASPELIAARSHGEVYRPVTMNYQTLKPERGGLFCARIFGPMKDYECLCGRYKLMEHRGVVCEKCGVEVIQSKVRSERMGHITLAVPVVHPWFVDSISCLLDIGPENLFKVLRYEAVLILDPKETKLPKNGCLSLDQFYEQTDKYGEGFDFDAGSNGVKLALENIDLENLAQEIHDELIKPRSDINKLAERLRLVEWFIKSGNKPVWMILTIIPVLPPNHRLPIIKEGIHPMKWDINNIYSRILISNLKIKKQLELGMSEMDIYVERAIELQEEINSLFNHYRWGKSQEEYDNAIADFTKAIELDPQCVDAYIYRAMAYYGKGQHEKARIDWDQSIIMNRQ